MNIESARGLRAGRLGRGAYFLYMVGSMFLFIFVGVIIDGIIRGSFEGQPSAILILPMVGWYAFAIYCSILRLRDLNMTAWWLLGLLVPAVNIYVAVKLFLFAAPEQVQS